MTHDELIQAIEATVLQVAKDRRESAAYNGAKHDGGASVLEGQVRWYEYGRKGVVPPEWEEYARAVKNERDPEWKDYQRLRKKFEKTS